MLGWLWLFSNSAGVIWWGFCPVFGCKQCLPRTLHSFLLRSSDSFLSLVRPPEQAGEKSVMQFGVDPAWECYPVLLHTDVQLGPLEELGEVKLIGL